MTFKHIKTAQDLYDSQIDIRIVIDAQINSKLPIDQFLFFNSKTVLCHRH